MKLTDFYRRLNEIDEPVPVGVCVDFEDYIKTTRELGELRVRDIETFCENCGEVEFYIESGLPEAQIFCSCCERVVEPEVDEPEDRDTRVTERFRTMVNDRFSTDGCSFLLRLKEKTDETLTSLQRRDADPETQNRLSNEINYVNGIIRAQNCERRVQDANPQPTVVNQPTAVKQPTVVNQPNDTPPQETQVGKSIEQTFEEPTVIPQPLYQKEDELVNIDSVQNDELLGDLQIDLDKEIMRQPPEVQQRLKQFKIDAEKMSYVIPLTLEGKNFMMELEMSGIKLPYLMLYYENTKPLYGAMEQNKHVKFNELQPLKNRVNYKEFWEWTKSIWESNNSWLKTKVYGTIPEFDKSTILP
jgi:hypothetical protein